MKASTKRILSVFLAGLFFIAVIIIYGNLIRPELVRVDEKRSVAASKLAIFNEQKAAVQGVAALIQEFESSVKLEENVSLAMPKDEAVNAMLNQLEAIGRASGATISSFTVNPLAFQSSRQALVKRLGTLELNLSVQGSYQSIKNFLAFLESNVRVVNLKSFRITPITLGQADDFYLLVIKAEIYYQE